MDYDIEGSDLGYRWNARKGHSALFPFGYGLSFTRFESSGLSINDKTGSFTVKNIGDRAGATVAQLYMIATPRGKQQRLVAFQRNELNPGESRRIVLPIEQRIVAEYEGDGSGDFAWDLYLCTGGGCATIGCAHIHQFGLEANTTIRSPVRHLQENRQWQVQYQ